MNYDLTPEQQRFIEATVRSGRFRNASEVLREGLQLLIEREAAEKRRHDAWKEDVRRRVEEGWQQLERGEVVDGETVFRDLQERIDAQRAKKR